LVVDYHRLHEELAALEKELASGLRRRYRGASHLLRGLQHRVRT
jgi:hypothetical protein